MDYRSLLDDDNWKRKRKEILYRDNYECQRCGVSKNLTMNTDFVKFGDVINRLSFEFLDDMILKYKLAKINFIPEWEDGLGVNYDLETICKTNIFEIDKSKPEDYFVTVHYVNKDKIKYPFNGSLINNLKPNIFLNNCTNASLIKHVRGQISNILDVDLEGIWLINSKYKENYRKNGNVLHVHHKCYRMDQEIWEQPDVEYTTLCNICHKIVHEHQMIPFYNSENIVIQNMITCSRCSGNGYLSEFKHVQSGICFRCRGKRYIN
ncbi:MAG: hypothetical protein IPJ51_02575 [Saprospiraceae bacterium]|nr:hypothetical protein [Saprospiraceae bacterium]